MISSPADLPFPPDEDGKLIGSTKITRDRTERGALEQAREQLYQAQKMESVGQLTGGMAQT